MHNIKVCHFKRAIQWQVGQLRLICHPELRDELGAWVIKGGGVIHKDGENRCLVIRCLHCDTERSFRKCSSSEPGPLSKFF